MIPIILYLVHRIHCLTHFAFKPLIYEIVVLHDPAATSSSNGKLCPHPVNSNPVRAHMWFENKCTFAAVLLILDLYALTAADQNLFM